MNLKQNPFPLPTLISVMNEPSVGRGVSQGLAPVLRECDYISWLLPPFLSLSKLSCTRDFFSFFPFIDHTFIRVFLTELNFSVFRLIVGLIFFSYSKTVSRLLWRQAHRVRQTVQYSQDSDRKRGQMVGRTTTDAILKPQGNSKAL